MPSVPVLAPSHGFHCLVTHRPAREALGWRFSARKHDESAPRPVAADSGLDSHRTQKTLSFGVKEQLIVLGNDPGVHRANPDWVEPPE